MFPPVPTDSTGLPPPEKLKRKILLKVLDVFKEITYILFFQGKTETFVEGEDEEDEEEDESSAEKSKDKKTEKKEEKKEEVENSREISYIDFRRKRKKYTKQLKSFLILFI